jgi:hypothetical protein
MIQKIFGFAKNAKKKLEFAKIIHNKYESKNTANLSLIENKLFLGCFIEIK